MEAVRTSETSVDNHFTRQYNPEDSSEHHSVIILCMKFNSKSKERFWKVFALLFFFHVLDVELLWHFLLNTCSLQLPARCPKQLRNKL
jgi:hypothetical protein